MPARRALPAAELPSGTGEEPTSPRSSARSHQPQRPVARAANPTFSSFHALFAPSRRQKGGGEGRWCPRSGTGAEGQPRGTGLSIADLAVRRVPFVSSVRAASGAQWRLEELPRCHLKPAFLPARLCSAPAFSCSGLSDRREEARAAPQAGGRPPPGSAGKHRSPTCVLMLLW